MLDFTVYFMILCFIVSLPDGSVSNTAILNIQTLRTMFQVRYLPLLCPNSHNTFANLKDFLRTMKFLFLTSHPLIPNNAGNTVRTYSIMKWLKSNGHLVNWISFVTEKEQEYINANKEELDIICDKFIPIPINRKKAYFNCIKAIITGKPFKAEFYNFKSANEIIKNELQNSNYDYVSGYLYLTTQFLKFCKNEKKSYNWNKKNT